MHVSWVGYVEQNVREVSARFEFCRRLVHAELKFTNQMLNERHPEENGTCWNASTIKAHHHIIQQMILASESNGASSHKENGIILKDHEQKVEKPREIMAFLHFKTYSLLDSQLCRKK
ncbi:hypothetical protein T265_11485 [Opisthorchis viverrini]|uniref:Uncharacterized protein n=1 Tax=Opisthorchis viverrini TaxID=6198 RepID=A0A074Z2T8_OPIVI|nr:hypothetical protein T265_11485 [Opisthorchis viverrini]KER19832.1 hypothetical protein T265_11485 [Opisthorchis viverrini]